MSETPITILKLPAQAMSASHARHVVAGLARTVACLSASDVDDLCVAVGEAFANVVRHASGEEFVGLRVEIRPDHLAVHLDYAGLPFDPRPGVPEPDELASGGYGLFIMRSLADAVVFDFQGGRTHLRLEKRCAAPVQ